MRALRHAAARPSGMWSSPKGACAGARQTPRRSHPVWAAARSARTTRRERCGRRRDTMQRPLAWAGKFWVAPLLAPPCTLQMAPQCQNGRKLQDIAHDFDPVSWETHVCKGPRPSRKARGTACGSAWGSTDALDARAEWRNAPRTRAGHHRCTRRAARPRRRLSGWTPASSRGSKAPQAGMWHLAGVAAGPLACGGVGACQCKQQLPNL